MSDPVDLSAALASFHETWAPRTVATMNDYDVRVAKAHGEFTPHRHPDTDELFLVITGALTIRLEDEDEVVLGPGQMYVVPRGRLHQPVADEETHLLLFEPSNTVNTGDSPSELTAERRLVEQ